MKNVLILLVVLLVGGASGYFAYHWQYQQTPVTDTNMPTPVPPPVINSSGEHGTMVTVYDGVSVSSGATTLDLSGRGLTGSLKAEVGQMTALQVLNLSHNQFTGLPAEVGHLSHLTTLNLSYNQFTGLPHELGNLSALKVLDLRGNNISPTDLATIKAALPATTQILQ